MHVLHISTCFMHRIQLCVSSISRFSSLAHSGLPAVLLYMCAKYELLHKQLYARYSLSRQTGTQTKGRKRTHTGGLATQTYIGTCYLYRCTAYRRCSVPVARGDVGQTDKPLQDYREAISNLENSISSMFHVKHEQAAHRRTSTPTHTKT